MHPSIKIREKLRDTLAIMIPPNRLGQQIRHIDDTQLRRRLRLLRRNRKRIRHNNLINALALFHLLKAVPTEQTVRRHAVHLRGPTPLHHRLRGRDPGAGLVDHVIDDEDGPVPDVADERDSGLELRVLETLFFVVRGSGIAGAAEGLIMLPVHGRRGGHGGSHHVIWDLLVVGAGAVTWIERGHSGDGGRGEVVVNDVAVDETAGDDVACTLLSLALCFTP